MATLASPHRIRDGEPAGFDKKADVKLQLQYRINDNGAYEFSYKVACSPNQGLMFEAANIEQAVWSPYMAQDAFTASLDIGIKDFDTLVQVDTVGADLVWSLQRDAVMTLHDHSDKYGELRYSNGSDWLRREEYDKPNCRRIRFKAKHNAGGKDGERHKFSYNVRLRNSDGDMVEHEIDPDIQNPKV